MAAGFTIKKNKIKLLDNYIQKDYFNKISEHEILLRYDSEISSTAVNKNFINEINQLGPFGNYNFLPIFLIKKVKIIKSNIINHKHVSSIIKPNSGSTIKAICFNCLNSKIGEYLLSYKNEINIIAEINENIWNNKKSIQLNIKDLIL